MNLLIDIFVTFAKIGAFTFGGGYAMISLIDHECVEKKQWISSDELADITVIAESTPGPIAINCATYTGYKQSGMAGALVATIGMIMPSFVIILVISYFFEKMLENPLVSKAFGGIRVAVSILIIQAALKMIKKMMKKTQNKLLSMAFVSVSFVVVFALNVLKISFSTIWMVLISGILGYALYAGKGGVK